MVNKSNWLRSLWGNNAPLTFTAILMTGALLVFLAGLVVDHRSIGGVPAWLKPAKFAISTAIFAGTAAWLFRYLHVWLRTMRFLARLISAVLVVEVTIIALQAARGTTSHFNLSTPFDAVMFAIMGVSIGLLWLGSIGLLIGLLRQKFADPVWGWALRLGMAITVTGAAAGGLMLRPTHEQLAIAAMKRPPASGGHTVGAPDGGRGLPGVGWSREHGDLRIPHFFGLHGVQLIPLLTFLARRRGWRITSRTVFAGAGSYLAFTGILTWQALRGQSIMQPDSATLLAFSVWAGVSAIALALAKERRDTPLGTLSFNRAF